MDPQPLITNSERGPVELRMTAAGHQRLFTHLFPGDGDEHGAALLCGHVRTGRGTRLLVREVVLAEDGVDYVPGRRGYRELRGEFVTHQVRRARDLGLAYLAVHNHRGSTSVAFSDPDLASHERAYPTLRQVARQPVGGLVCAMEAIAGDIWWPDGTRTTIDRTVILGSNRTVLTPAVDRTEPSVSARYDRQSLLYGSAGQAIVGATKVVVVGAGGVGMLVVQLLARLGVGHIVVIDPDRAEPSNLPRLPEATRLDAMEYLDRDGMPVPVRRVARRLARHKVRIARRIARRANPRATITAIIGDVADDHVARQLIDADFLLLAADTMLARDVVNQVAYQYLIPGLQVGSKISVDPITGAVSDVFAVVRHLATVEGCLRCSGLIDPARLTEESVGDLEQIANQQYVDDPDVDAPSVITLNAVGAGFAAQDVMLHSVGLPAAEPGYRIIRSRPRGRNGQHVTVQEPFPDPGCHVCSNADHSARARGDACDLPTRLASPIAR